MKADEPTYEYGDNAEVVIIGREKETFELAMKLAARYQFCKDEPLFYFHTIDDEKGFVLLSSSASTKNKTAFPCPIKTKLLTKIVWNWLINTIKDSDKSLHKNLLKESNMDFDGSSSVGFKVYTEEIGIDHAVMAIKPWLIWFGK